MNAPLLVSTTTKPSILTMGAIVSNSNLLCFSGKTLREVRSQWLVLQAGILLMKAERITISRCSWGALILNQDNRSNLLIQLTITIIQHTRIPKTMQATAQQEAQSTSGDYLLQITELPHQYRLRLTITDVLEVITNTGLFPLFCSHTEALGLWMRSWVNKGSMQLHQWWSRAGNRVGALVLVTTMIKRI